MTPPSEGDVPAALFEALGSPIRMRIVLAVAARASSAPASELAQVVEPPLHPHTLSRHLRQLLECRILQVTRQGARTVYRIHPDAQAQLTRAIEVLTRVGATIGGAPTARGPKYHRAR
jgi:DNA-binding transcriptional ArsR family regulator